MAAACWFTINSVSSVFTPTSDCNKSLADIFCISIARSAARISLFVSFSFIPNPVTILISIPNALTAIPVNMISPPNIEINAPIPITILFVDSSRFENDLIMSPIFDNGPITISRNTPPMSAISALIWFINWRDLPDVDSSCAAISRWASADASARFSVLSTDAAIPRPKSLIGLLSPASIWSRIP